MVCDVIRRQNQTVEQRKEEIRETVAKLSEGLASGRIKPVVGQQGAITFTGWTENERNSVTDACALRKIMAEGSSLAKMAIARAELLAGRRVDTQVVNAGVHSHDGGKTWSGGH